MRQEAAPLMRGLLKHHAAVDFGRVGEHQDKRDTGAAAA
jgi:hypothetical protein